MTNYIIKEIPKWQGNNSNCKIKIQTNKQKKRHLNRESNGKIAKKMVRLHRNNVVTRSLRIWIKRTVKITKILKPRNQQNK